MANMTFKANLLPSSNLGYNLGSSSLKWNVYGDLKGNADTATKISSTPNNTTSFLRGDNTWSNTLTGGFNLKSNNLDITNTTTSSSYIFSNGYMQYIDTNNQRLFVIHAAESPTGVRGFYLSNQAVKINGTTYQNDLWIGNKISDGSPYIDVGGAAAAWRTALNVPSREGIDAYGTWGINITGNAATATKLSNTPSNTTTFLRGDNIWTNQLANYIFNSTDIAEGADNLATQATVHKMTFYRNGITIPYQMDNANDGGMLRVRGTSEATTIYEMATWDDSGAGETIQFNYYPTSSQITPTYSISVPKHSGTLVTTDGNGASGTWGINITGSAGSVAWGNVTEKPGSFTPSSHSHSYLPLSGGTMTGAINFNNMSGNSIYNGPNDQTAGVGGSLNNLVIGSWWGVSFTSVCGGQTYSGTNAFSIDCRSGIAYTNKMYGAVWNDYAEFRETKNDIEPGRCIREIGDDTLVLTTDRLQPGCEIVSDTYGFAIGESDRCKTPTATSGRVLAYLYEDRELAKQHIGEPVCSGPNGTVSLMTHEEEKEWPSRIIGTISAVPDYEEWECGGNKENPIKIKVNGRIWIRIR